LSHSGDLIDDRLGRQLGEHPLDLVDRRFLWPRLVDDLQYRGLRRR
jgi:hypothetical protein